MLDARLRAGVGKALAPMGRGLRQIGITADLLTVVGLACSGITAWLIAIGELRWAVLGLVASGLIDLLDGSVARTSGEASPRGAFFDSVTDRVSDALVFGGCAWYLASEGAHLPVLAFAAAALAMLISYERARAEALGYSARGGLMERAERMVVLGVGLMFGILVPVLWLMVALMTFTAIQRFVVVWRQASDTPAPRVRRLRLVRHRRADEEEELGLAAGDEGRSLTAWWDARRTAGDGRAGEGRGPRHTRPARRRTRP
jgi:CDP-diacylglycerol--glycerol-3-phosphate 3-phosphatidyltransferase